MGWSGNITKSNSKKQVPNTTPNSNSAGCMSALFHFFNDNFHHFQLPLNHPQTNNYPLQQQVDLTIPKGVEAPRNSLELNQSPLISNIQKGIQIKTRPKNGDSSSENNIIICSSPSAKTPTLVARLMGLDILPEINSQSSPSSSSSTPNLQSLNQRKMRNRSTTLKTFMDNNDNNNFSGTRSLPETPRISLARRSSDSDNVDHHHRLSLQINKENILNEENNNIEFSRLRRKYYYHQQDENYNKESRKVALVDITNTVKSREKSNYYNSNYNNQTNCEKLAISTSCSPRLRCLDNKNKTNTPTSNTKDQTPKPSANPANNFQSQSINVKVISPKPKQVIVQEVDRAQKSKKNKTKLSNNNDRFGLVKKPSRNKQEEPFVRAPTIINLDHHHHHYNKKTPLSSELLNISSVPNLLHHVKKDPATKIPSKLVAADAQQSKQTISSQLSSCPSQKTPHVSRDNYNGYTTTTATTAATSTVDGDEELKSYVTKILKSTGINKLHTPLSLSLITRCQFSPLQPINPSIFNHIEHDVTKYGGGGETKLGLGLRCNRELTFHLVNEVLVQILKPHVVKPWVNRDQVTKSKEIINGSDLIDILCSKINGFPRADCQVLEDIDALIHGDWPPLKHQIEEAFEDEGDGIVTEIEREILETLIHETAVDFED